MELIYLKDNALLLNFGYYIHCKDSYVVLICFFIYISTIYKVTIVIAILYYDIMLKFARV